jgi:hypothetical protein
MRSPKLRTRLTAGVAAEYDSHHIFYFLQLTGVSQYAAMAQSWGRLMSQIPEAKAHGVRPIGEPHTLRRPERYALGVPRPHSTSGNGSYRWSNTNVAKVLHLLSRESGS